MSSAELILGGLENGDGGAAGPVLEGGVVGGGGEVVDERGAVAVVDAAGEEVVAKAVGDAFGAEGGEGLDAFVVDGEAAVAGVALLFAFGRRGLLAGVLYANGSSLAFSTTAVILAQAFVSAPFFVQAALSAFRRIDERLLWVARSFGASPLRVFVRVALPLSWPGLFAGAAMTWARALGEFGATLMFAGNLSGSTQTLPLAIYGALESNVRSAQALSVLLVVIAFAALLGVRALLRRFEAQGQARP